MNASSFKAIIAFFLILSAGSIYVWKIFKRQVEPTLSTWLIFLAGTSMAFVSYLISTHRDFSAGALNGADVFSDLIIIMTILFFGATRWKLKSFEKYYLLGLIVIGFFWFLTSDAYHSNLLIQILLTLAYGPTLHSIIKLQRNTESFLTWGIILLASVVSLYPAFMAWLANKNILGLVYSGRSVVLAVLLLAVMFIFRSTKGNMTSMTKSAGRQ